MPGLRLGDDIDDYCVKCKRITNHSILAIVSDKPAKVRCRSCYNEQAFRDGVVPPSRRELKKAALLEEVMKSMPGAEERTEPAKPPPKKGRAKT